MATTSSLLCASFCFLVLFSACFAQIEQVTSSSSVLGGHQQHQQQHRLRSRSRCRIEKIDALEPTDRIKAEAGFTEFWDDNNEQLRCAGVSAARHVIQPKGLLLPHFANAPHLTYIIQGKGIAGITFPGCAETYQSSREDQHQKIRNFREGDIVAFPAGVSHWVYNDGQEDIVAVTVFDTSNDANQLDRNLRKFFLAGRSRHGQETGEKGQHQQEGNTVFSGFGEQLLADIYKIDNQLVKKLQSQNDRRGSIVRVHDEFRVISPERSVEEQERQSRPGNGLEETFCSMRLRQNINDPNQADVYNPRGGRVTSLNSHKLPILKFLQLSAERGVLYKNAVLAPQWNMNAHSVVYITKGSTRMQIVGDNGQTVFDGQVREGQLIVVPQNFAVVKKADRQGCEWVSFKTNDNAVVNTLAGRLSAIRGMPVEVVMNAYNMDREEANKVKFNQEELTVFGPGSRSRD